MVEWVAGREGERASQRASELLDETTSVARGCAGARARGREVAWVRVDEKEDVQADEQYSKNSVRNTHDH